jgi:hypothetical protein
MHAADSCDQASLPGHTRAILPGCIVRKRAWSDEDELPGIEVELLLDGAPQPAGAPAETVLATGRRNRLLTPENN